MSLLSWLRTGRWKPLPNGKQPEQLIDTKFDPVTRDLITTSEVMGGKDDGKRITRRHKARRHKARRVK